MIKKTAGDVFISFSFFRFVSRLRCHPHYSPQALDVCEDKNVINNVARQIRQLNYISQFCQTFTHIAVRDSVVADTLPRLEINAMQVSDFGINRKQFAVGQQTGAAAWQLKNNPGELQIKGRQLENSTNAMLDDVSTENFRPIIPTTFQDVSFQKFHFFHMGAQKQ